MKSLHLAASVLAFGLAIAAPNLSLAHVGHGDEFQAEGGINRVKINPQMDPILGIQVAPIEAAGDGSGAVLIPMTALVEADGKQLTFVEYEGFYEPVPVTTGATQGELIEITSGLSVGEVLVTQGSLSLYAESRKTQDTTAEPTAAAAPEPTAETVATATAEEAAATTTPEATTPEAAPSAPIAAEPATEPATEVTLAQADSATETTAKSGGFPTTVVIGSGAVALIAIGTVLMMQSGSKDS
ncbi:MAG: cobalt transporter [Prochlorothrix sp.]